MQQVADGGQRQCLWASAQPVEVRHMSTELLSCAGLVRDPAFGFKMELLTQRQEGVATMIDLAGRLGYHIVAQGVERQEEADLLQAMGCVFAQGDLFSSELSADEFFVMATDLVPVTEPPSP